MNIKFITIESSYNLLEICASSSIKSYSYIKLLYENNFTNFIENLEFLEILGIVKSSNQSIQLIKNISINELQIINLFCKKIRKFPEVEDFLSKFTLIDDYLIFQPTLSEILNSTEIRKLLESFGLLEVTNKECIIKNTILIQHQKAIPISPELLKKKLHKQELRGQKAEEIAINYEKTQAEKILGYIPKNVIKHVSLINVSAGYDIVSFNKELAYNGTIRKIFIEVKAVDENDFRFYFSNNEIQTAKKYGESYYLYLVKIPEGEEINEEKSIVKISNPYNNVVCNGNWIQQIESISFKKQRTKDD